MFPTPQSWAKHRVLKITEIASLCPKNGTEHPPAYKTLFFFSWWWVKNANKSIRRQYCYDEYGAQREKTWHRLYICFIFLFQWPELLSLGTVDIRGQTIPSCSIPRLHPPDAISTSPSVRTKNVFRKCQMVPGGSTCTSNPRPEDQFPTSWKMWPSQPTVRLGKASRPETMSVCWSIYLHLYLSQTIYLSICLPFSTIPPSHSASVSFCSSESVSKIPNHLFFGSLIQPP